MPVRCPVAYLVPIDPFHSCRNQWICFFMVRFKVVDVKAKIVNFLIGVCTSYRGVIQYIVIRGVENHTGVCVDGCSTVVKRMQKECFHSTSVLFGHRSSKPLFMWRQRDGRTDKKIAFFSSFPSQDSPQLG